MLRRWTTIRNLAIIALESVISLCIVTNFTTFRRKESVTYNKWRWPTLNWYTRKNNLIANLLYFPAYFFTARRSYYRRFLKITPSGLPFKSINYNLRVRPCADVPKCSDISFWKDRTFERKWIWHFTVQRHSSTSSIISLFLLMRFLTPQLSRVFQFAYSSLILVHSSFKEKFCRKKSTTL